MTMTAERSGSCSTAVAPLDLVEEVLVLEDLTEAVLEAAEAEGVEEVDAGKLCVSEAIQKVTQKDERPFEHVSFSSVSAMARSDDEQFVRQEARVV